MQRREPCLSRSIANQREIEAKLTDAIGASSNLSLSHCFDRGANEWAKGADYHKTYRGGSSYKESMKG
jgi:hypothetical protein